MAFKRLSDKLKEGHIFSNIPQDMTARRAKPLHTTVNANPLFNLLRLSLLKMVLLFLTTRDENTAIILPRALFTVFQLIHKVKLSKDDTKPFEYRTEPAIPTGFR